MPFNAKKNQFIIVVYHYIRNVKNTKFPGIRACSIKKFQQHLEFLLKSYTIVTLSELYQKVQHKSKDNRNYCALTFDDGLIDHYQNVLPLLKKYSLTGTFFPITTTLEQKVPITHKIHVLLSKVPVSRLVDMLEEFMKNEYSMRDARYRIPREKRLRPANRKFEDVLTANFKDTVISLPQDKKTCFLEECFKIYSLNEGEICKSLFMDRDKLQKLMAEGMDIGGHTHRHFALDSLDNALQIEEINTSKSILEDFLHTKINIFSYPHGRFNDFTLEILERSNFAFALTIEGRNVRHSDGRFTLPRYDTNDLVI